MLKLEFSHSKARPLNVLCLGAHSDDIEIGCGGTILKLLSSNPAVNVHWVVLGAAGDREKEARTSAERLLAGAAGKKIVIKGFRDSFFPYIGAEIKEYFEQIKKEISPDIIFTHCRHDLHQDHRLTCELTWNTFRDHLILEYEILKYDGDLGEPNIYSHLSAEIAQRKVDNVLEVFRTQGSRSWFTKSAFMAIMRIRGVESNSRAGFAEAFYCRKAVI